MSIHRTAKHGVGAIALLAGIWGSGAAALASETVLLRYQSFGRPVPVEDLTTLAETGEAPESIAGLLDMTGQDPASLQQVLTEPISANPSFLDRALNSWPGEWTLDQVGTTIHPPSGQASRQALRSAIVLSAVDDRQITLLEILQKYPSPQVVLRVDQMQTAYQYLATLLGPLSIF